MQVGRWGNSLAIRLPTSLVERNGLRQGDEVVVTLVDQNDNHAVCACDRAQALARLGRLNWRPPPGFVFVRSERIDDAAAYEE